MKIELSGDVEGHMGATANPLHKERDDYYSRKFVSANNITSADVWNPDSESEWFGIIWNYAQWIKQQPESRRFVAWNGRLYFTSDIVAGKMPETPGLAAHILP